jgi:AmiR/NasT family two-component response regulator
VATKPQTATSRDPHDAATRRLRVLVADEDKPALDSLAGMLSELGHEVLPYAVSIAEAAQVIADDDPDVALVRLHRDDQHALRLIGQISEFASGPVIALLDEEDTEFVSAAAEEGIYAYAQPVTAESTQGAIEVAVRRHAELAQLGEKVDQLETALQRRSIIERAKGILMERHSLDDTGAFALLRDEARRSNRKVIDLARAVAEGRSLLPRA